MESMIGWALLVTGALFGYALRDILDTYKSKREAQWPSWLARTRSSK